MRHYGFLALGFATLFTGCDLFALKAKPAAPAPTTSAAPAPAVPGTTGLMPQDLNQLGAPVGGAPAGGAPAGGAPAAPGTQQEVAGVGSGIGGRSLDGPGVVEMIALPAKTYFAAKETIIYDKMMHDLQLYKASDSEGMGPQSHEEFMDKVIRENGTVLPTLPPGQRFVYDPKTEQLMIEKPAKK